MRIEIKIAKPELASLFIDEVEGFFKNNDSIIDFRQQLAKGSFDKKVEEYSQGLNLEFDLSDKPTLQQLIELNKLDYHGSLNSDIIQKILYGRPVLERGEAKLAIGKELYEMLEPLRQHERGKFLILERELWDYLSLGLFRNFVLARWEDAIKKDQFLKRTLVSPKADPHPPFTSRSVHALYRLYWAYHLVRDEPHDVQIILFRIEQALQDYLQRKFFFCSQNALCASLIYCKENGIYGNTNQVKRLIRLHRALNEALFTGHLSKKEYANFLTYSIPQETLNEVLALDKNKLKVKP